MIDPPKATKGRRMSKKSRKKTSKTPSPRKVKAKSAVRSKTKVRKLSSVAANKSGDKATGSASHKAALKRSKISDKATGSGGATAPKSRAAGSPADKPAVMASISASAASEGSKAPAFRLPRDGGGTLTLSDFSGRKLVLFFYPRADTPGCTREAIDFTRLSGPFADAGTAVLGVSADPVKAQDKFRDKHGLSVPLMSDESHKTLEAYGAWGEKSMYGKTFLGVIRTTVLIGADGRIAKMWRYVKVDGHAEAVLAAARAL
jgi:peroxiredoxin Q/BCP